MKNIKTDADIFPPCQAITQFVAQSPGKEKTSDPCSHLLENCRVAFAGGNYNVIIMSLLRFILCQIYHCSKGDCAPDIATTWQDEYTCNSVHCHGYYHQGCAFPLRNHPVVVMKLRSAVKHTLFP